MPRVRPAVRGLLLALAWSLCQVAPTARGQGFAPDEAVRHMKLPEGLAAQLVAAEPLVRQPVAIEFDDRGRLWVIQYLQYPNPAGLTRTKVDRYSRTTYDRVPEPPPRGPRGADRVTILSDTDGDGRADAAKDFVDGLNLATGLAFGHGGVFVLQAPYLLFYADENRDDVPDGDPQTLVSGFGIEDAHSVANSLTWGPDGWLYGCQGSTVTARIGDLEFQQGVWRYHPPSKRFELFCEGGGNSWGLDFDRHGNLFYSTNFGGYALLHGVQGAYYWKQFGKHGALHNPFAYGYFDHVPHRDLRGGHVTVGGLVYQADELGPQFRDKYIGADLLGHAAYWHELEPRGSTFSARWVGDLLLAGDTHFAPSDVTTGPDGAIYICDWHDQRTAHPDPDAQWDATNGRIFRIAPPGTKALVSAKLDARDATTGELVARLEDRNAWYVRRARIELARRRDAGAAEALAKIAAGDDEARALEALWALNACGALTPTVADPLLSHASPHVRAWTARLVGDEMRPPPFLGMRLGEIARYDESVIVRAQLACTARRLPLAQALSIIEPLVGYSEDADDPYMPLLLWWAVERHAVTGRQPFLKLFTRPQIWQQALARDTIIARLVRRYAAENSKAGELACAELIAAAPSEHRPRLLAALEAGLADRAARSGDTGGALFADQAPLAQAPVAAAARPRLELASPLAAEIDRAWDDQTRELALLRLAARLGRQAAPARVIALAQDEALPVQERIAAITAMGEIGQEAAVEPLLRLVGGPHAEPLQLAALAALARIDDERIAAALLERLPALAPPLRGKAQDVLLGRKAWAARLLAAVDAGQFAPADVALEQLRVVPLHGDAALDALVKKHWGTIARGTPEERLAEMRRLNNDLRAGAGDPAAGHALFNKHCGTCHRLFGEGNEVGPELTHANRKNTAELLATIVDPSAVVRREYASFLVQTRDGRVVTGLLVEQTPGAITLLGAKNERTTLAREAIESIGESSVSLMPDDLLKPLAPQELRDLFSYLQSDPPPPAVP